MRSWIALVALCLFSPAEAQGPTVETLAPGVHLVRGVTLPERGPDGNTTIFETPGGLVVVDTGRHAWHRDAILAFAAARGRAVSAIVNTHWHLDHSSGNRRIKARYPRATVHTTAAVRRALAAGGSLMREQSRTEARAVAPGSVAAEEKQIFLDTMTARAALLPDREIARGGRMRLGGRPFDVFVTQGAVTDADVWLFDRRTRVAVLGDLVTLPAPFFETACPERWREELDRVWATPFTLAVPGHGAPMDRAAFDAYRIGFGGFVDCVGSDAEPAVCAHAWADAAAPLGAERREAEAYARYYVGFLRGNGGKSPDCVL
jgi:glyoxylase-like metal-dependent hydrolase (beta-lactamase superfamily II)